MLRVDNPEKWANNEGMRKEWTKLSGASIGLNGLLKLKKKKLTRYTQF